MHETMASLLNTLLILFFFQFSSLYVMPDMENAPSKGLEERKLISLGAILDDDSRAGREEKIAMEIAIQGFYNAHVNYQPTTTLQVKNSYGDSLRAASSAKSLIEKNGVKAILGLGTWEEAASVAPLGNKSRVPILSVANEVPVWASSHWPFLVHTARSQFGQLKAIAAIIQTWQWKKVNIIYEDIDSAVFTGMIPFLIADLQQVNVEIGDLLVLPHFSSHHSISKELKKLKNAQCKVFIVHTSLELGVGIFREAKKLGMIEKDSVWIVTDAIGNYVDTLTKSSISSMQGVVGIKTYFSINRKRFKDFRTRFRIMFRRKYPLESNPEPGIFALQAYDAMWSTLLAMHGSNSTDQLLSRILASNFEGLTGKFSFNEGRLASAHIFQLVNVVGKSYKELGYWTEGLGFSTCIGKGRNSSKTMEILGQVFWPGGPLSVPRGWEVSPSGKRLKIGVPMGNTHPEFVNVTHDYHGKPIIINGFSIAVFNATLNFLPYHLEYDLVPSPGTYDHMVEQVQLENFDAVVGDTAILAKRCEYAEFSQPYSESGLQILLYKRPNRFEKAWLFKKPFTTTMWATTAAINLYNGFTVWLIERNYRPEFRGPIQNQIGTMLALSFTTLFSIPGDRMNSNLSRMAMVVWLFVALVITQSFTASLTSFLSAQQDDATTIDVDTLKISGAKVGCDGNSFVVKYLQDVLGFQADNIVKVYSEDEYPQLLKNGDIAVAFLEVPYIKAFLAKYCDGFTTAKQTFKVGGFGFVFPKSSPYLPDISEAVVKVSETGKLMELERALLSSHNCSSSSSSSSSSSDSEDAHDQSLGINSFQGLFLVSTGTTTISLLLFIFRRLRHNRVRFLNEAQQQHDPRQDEQFMFHPEINQFQSNHPLQ